MTKRDSIQQPKCNYKRRAEYMISPVIIASRYIFCNHFSSKTSLVNVVQIKLFAAFIKKVNYVGVLLE